MTAKDAPGRATGLGRRAYSGADSMSSGSGRVGVRATRVEHALGRARPWGRGHGRRGQRRAAGDGRHAERATSWRGALCLLLFRWYCFGNRIALIYCIEVDQVMNTKVVDLATLKNFYKGYIGFFCTEFELFECQY
jgi:hypothetical protein